MRAPHTIMLIASLAAPMMARALGPSAPFTPPFAASAAATSQIAAAKIESGGLTGLRLGASPQALIDGRWHAVGDIVRGARLSAVTRRGATLQHPGGRSEQLSLRHPSGGDATTATPDTEPARPR